MNTSATPEQPRPAPVVLQSVVGRRFPIMMMADRGKQLPAQMNSIPWELIAPHEKQALRNHAQNLEKLAYRGGLSPCEAVAILEDKDYRTRWPKPIQSAEEMVAHNTEAINRLRELCPSNDEASDRRPAASESSETHNGGSLR